MYLIYDDKGNITGIQTFPEPGSFQDDQADAPGAKTAAQKWADYMANAPVIEVPDGTAWQGKTKADF